MSEKTQNITQSANRVPRPRAQTHTAPNGQEIPVIVRPMSNGESANNVDIIDISPKINTPFGEISIDDYVAFFEQAKNIFEKHSAIDVLLVVKKEVIAGSQQVDKKTNIPKVDSEGNPIFWADRYSLTVKADDDELRFQCDKVLFDSVEEGRRYDFKGRNRWVMNFGRREWVTVYTVALPVGLAS